MEARAASSHQDDRTAGAKEEFIRFLGERQKGAELAEDLRAFLENRVVKAYRTEPAAEFKKWVERNRVHAVSRLCRLLPRLLRILGGEFQIDELRAKPAVSQRPENESHPPLVRHAAIAVAFDSALRSRG